MLDRLNQMRNELWEEEDTLREKYIDMYYALGMDPHGIPEPQDLINIKYKRIALFTAAEEIEKIEKGETS